MAKPPDLVIEGCIYLLEHKALLLQELVLEAQSVNLGHNICGRLLTQGMGPLQLYAFSISRGIRA